MKKRIIGLEQFMRFSGGPREREALKPMGERIPVGREDEFYEWRIHNPYYGRQFSVLGDSISTLEGYNPLNYHLYYTGELCEEAGVYRKEDTWWGKVIDYFGGNLLVNNSWSGSRVTKEPTEYELFPSGCSKERTGGLHTADHTPDAILIYLGVNDWANGVPVKETKRGYYDRKFGYYIETTDPGDETVFSFAYRKMLDQIKQNYPSAEIFCCTLNETTLSSQPSFKFPHSMGGIPIDEYNEVIKDAAAQKDCRLIDLYWNHTPCDTVDGIHPTVGGMDTLAMLMLRAMCDSYGASFMDCVDGHDFVTANVYTGGTRFVCRKCGLAKTEDVLPISQDRIQMLQTQMDADVVDLDLDRVRVHRSMKDGVRLFHWNIQEEYTIRKTEIALGRDNFCDLQLEDPIVSRVHAILRFDEDHWLLQDNHSTNGTWLNNVRLLPEKQYVLHEDDEISLAQKEKFIFFKSPDRT